MADHQLGDAPIQEQYRQQMIVIAQTLDEYLNGGKKGKDRENGFVLLVFPFGEPDDKHRCNFISNGASRKDIIVLMKEMIARFEGQPEIQGTA